MMTDQQAPSKPLVLLVEDEPSVRRSMQLLLQGHGFQVRSYGTEGALLADPMAPSAQGMVTDYQLPDGDGVDALNRLRSQGFAGGAIMVTAFNSTELTRRAEQAGFHRVLDKPLADRALTVALKQALAA